MKKYRISYQRLFLPKHKKGFEYKGENIDGIAIYFTHRIINKNNKSEKLFMCRDDEEPTEKMLEYVEGDWCYIYQFYFCNVDNESKTGYSMIPNKSLIEASDYDVEYEIDTCYKWFSAEEYPIEISHEEFVNILKNNMNQFNISDNKPTQITAYGTDIAE